MHRTEEEFGRCEASERQSEHPMRQVNVLVELAVHSVIHQSLKISHVPVVARVFGPAI